MSEQNQGELITPKKNESLLDRINNSLGKLSKIPLKDRLFFVQNLSIMLRAGISLSQGLKTLAIQTENKSFRVIISEIAEKVEKGSSFSEALKQYTKIFGEMFVNMVEAGELSGKLEDVLGQLFLQMKKENALMSKVKGALTYPAVIVVAMIGISLFLMMVVIPKMTVMFKTLGAELPLPTKILIAVSDAMAEHSIMVLIGLGLFIALTMKILKTRTGKYYFQLALLKLPVISPIIKKINLARFSRSISSLLKTDIMIIRSFQITASVLGNLHYRQAIDEMAAAIKKGAKISDSVAAHPKLFTPMVVQMVAIGEETGELDNILIELAEFYENEVDQIMENLPAIIEPLLILFLGLGTGAIAVAIVLPMYSITSNI